jgi:hypothetical protein
MLSVEIPPNARKLEQAALWILVGLFLALSMSWAVYPRVYDYYHPTPPWPGQPDNWFPSNAQVVFFGRRSAGGSRIFADKIKATAPT